MHLKIAETAVSFQSAELVAPWNSEIEECDCMNKQNDAAEKGPPGTVDITSLDTYSLMGLFLGLLAEKAWQTMGLRTKPGTDKIETDLDQSRVAIDAVAFLTEKLQPHLPDEQKRHLEGLVADLKLNYVRLTKT